MQTHNDSFTSHEGTILNQDEFKKFALQKVNTHKVFCFKETILYHLYQL